MIMEELNVLIIDDNEDDYYLINRQISKLDTKDFFGRVECFHVTSGIEALKIIQTSQFGCVFLDYYLPGQNGESILNEIKVLNPDLPVIILTGQGDEMLAAKLIKKGAADYIVKSDLLKYDLLGILSNAVEVNKNRHPDKPKVNNQTNIMVIDDSPEDREYISRIIKKFTRSDYNCIEADSGITALALLDDNPSDCVLVDYSLPGQNGIDLIKPIKEKYPHAAVIIITGKGDEKIAASSIKNGAEDYLIKSNLSSSDLISSIDRAIRNKELEKKLKEKEESIQEALTLLQRERMLFDAMSAQAKVGAWEYDVLNDCIYLSSMSKEIFGIDDSEDTDVEFLFDCFVNQQDVEMLRDCIRQSIIEGIPWKKKIKIKNKNNILLWIEASAEVDRVKSRTVRLYGAIHDIDERIRNEIELKKANEEAKAAVQSKSYFLANMSHEIRTPMNGVLGMLNLMSRTQLNQQQHHFIELAKHSADALLVVINDILDFSKIEAGKMDLEAVDFNLRDLFCTFTQTMVYKTDEKQLDLLLDISELKHTWVNSDPVRISQILINLVGNAIKFTEKGHVLIHVSTKGSDDGKVDLVCQVIDTGIGIPKSKRDQLFDSFTQADSSTTRRFGGTGLGLTISKQLCQLMGGGIKVADVDKGSCFEFDLLLNPCVQPELQAKNLAAGTELQVAALIVWFVSPNAKKSELIHKGIHARGGEGKEFLSIQDVMDVLASDTAQSELYPNLIVIDHCFIREGIYKELRHLWGETQPRGIKLALEIPYGYPDEYKDKLSEFSDEFIFKPIIPQQSFEFLLNEHKDQKAPKQQETNSDLQGRILLVEDNPINQEVVIELLSDSGVTIEVANNGEEAIDSLKNASKYKCAFDLILMDCQMPVMDGYEATTKIRNGEVGAHYRDIPIIALTANAMSGDKEKCIRFGMTDYLSKPLVIDELEDAIGRYCV